MQYYPCLVVLLAVVASSLEVFAAKSPILFLHGITGSQLETRHTSNDSLNDTCLFGADGYRGVWISFGLATTVASDCLVKGITLDYDSATSSYSDAAGVEVRAPGFGDTNTVEYLDTEGGMLLDGSFAFFNYFVERGYERGKTIRAAPYDWRLAPDQLDQRGYYTQLKMLVEEMYEYSNNTPVTIVTSSMGGPVSLYFFITVVNQEWKDQYINAFVPLAGPWAGATGGPVDGEVTGFSADPPTYCGLLNCAVLRPFVRSLQSLIWLLPHASIWGNTVVATTPNKTYTANDYSELFEDIGYPQGYNIYTDVEGINAQFPAPNVPVHCFYGTGIDTIETLNYDNGFPDTVANITFGDGDGVVNTRSSEVCLKWAEEQSQPFFSQAFPSVHHLSITSNTTVLEAIEEVLVVQEMSGGIMTTCARLTVVAAVAVAYMYSN